MHATVSSSPSTLGYFSRRTARSGATRIDLSARGLVAPATCIAKNLPNRGHRCGGLRRPEPVQLLAFVRPIAGRIAGDRKRVRRRAVSGGSNRAVRLNRYELRPAVTTPLCAALCHHPPASQAPLVLRRRGALNVACTQCANETMPSMHLPSVIAHDEIRHDQQEFREVYLRIAIDGLESPANCNEQPSGSLTLAGPRAGNCLFLGG